MRARSAIRGAAVSNLTGFMVVYAVICALILSRGVVSIFDGVYSVGKGANDRLVSEIAGNLVKPVDTGIRLLTLYPGHVSTEAMSEVVATAERDSSAELSGLVAGKWNAESPLYVGRVIAAIAGDSSEKLALERQGKIVIAAEAGNYYGVVDEGGQRRWSLRGLKFSLLTAVPFLRGGLVDRLMPDIVVPWFLLKLIVGAEPSVARR